MGYFFPRLFPLTEATHKLTSFQMDTKTIGFPCGFNHPQGESLTPFPLPSFLNIIDGFAHFHTLYK